MHAIQMRIKKKKKSNPRKHPEFTVLLTKKYHKAFFHDKTLPWLQAHSCVLDDLENEEMDIIWMLETTMDLHFFNGLDKRLPYN